VANGLGVEEGDGQTYAANFTNPFPGGLLPPTGSSQGLSTALGHPDMTSWGTGWPPVVAFLAVITMTVANFTAGRQESVKRMLAYSSIAHAGYMLLGFSVFSDAGLASIVFYVVTYCFMNLGAFLVVAAVAEQNGGDETMASFKGLGRRAPLRPRLSPASRARAWRRL